MDFLNKLQNKPEKVRNRIFWTALIVSVAVIGFFWIKDMRNSLEKIKTEGRDAKKSLEDSMTKINEESQVFNPKDEFRMIMDSLRGGEPEENKENEDFDKNQSK